MIGNEYDTKSYDTHISMISVGVVDAGGYPSVFCCWGGLDIFDGTCGTLLFVG